MRTADLWGLHREAVLEVAYHEAGHAIVGSALGAPVRHVAVGLDRAGRVSGHTDVPEDALSPDENALVHLAGEAATTIRCDRAGIPWPRDLGPATTAAQLRSAARQVLYGSCPRWMSARIRDARLHADMPSLLLVRALMDRPEGAHLDARREAAHFEEDLGRAIVELWHSGEHPRRGVTGLADRAWRRVRRLLDERWDALQSPVNHVLAAPVRGEVRWLSEQDVRAIVAPPA